MKVKTPGRKIKEYTHSVERNAIANKGKDSDFLTHENTFVFRIRSFVCFKCFLSVRRNCVLAFLLSKVRGKKLLQLALLFPFRKICCQLACRFI